MRPSPAEDATHAPTQATASTTPGIRKSVVATAYTARGTVKSVGGSYGTLVASVKRDADGKTLKVIYGDLAHTTTD